MAPTMLLHPLTSAGSHIQHAKSLHWRIKKVNYCSESSSKHFLWEDKTLKRPFLYSHGVKKSLLMSYHFIFVSTAKVSFSSSSFPDGLRRFKKLTMLGKCWLEAGSWSEILWLMDLQDVRMLKFLNCHVHIGITTAHAIVGNVHVSAEMWKWKPLLQVSDQCMCVSTWAPLWKCDPPGPASFNNQ